VDRFIDAFSTLPPNYLQPGCLVSDIFPMKIGSREWSNLVIKGATGFDIELNKHHTDQFAIHAEELMQWTAKTNLTSITDPLEVAVKHFLDSLVPAGIIPSGASLLDIGSGGGFPGIPLKVLIPSLSVTLIDASRKKTSFLKHVIRSLKLGGIEALHCRAEALADDPLYINRFDVIISRALTSLDSFVRLALPLLAKEGSIMALKGEADRQELADLQFRIIKRLNSLVSARQTLSVSVKKYQLPFIHSKRSIISIEKHDLVANS
jgi:16S rRNA (guanine527-N7)-methyltransferase